MDQRAAAGPRPAESVGKAPQALAPVVTVQLVAALVEPVQLATASGVMLQLAVASAPKAPQTAKRGAATPPA